MADVFEEPSKLYNSANIYAELLNYTFWPILLKADKNHNFTIK